MSKNTYKRLSPTSNRNKEKKIMNLPLSLARARTGASAKRRILRRRASASVKPKI